MPYLLRTKKIKNNKSHRECRKISSCSPCLYFKLKNKIYYYLDCITQLHKHKKARTLKVRAFCMSRWSDSNQRPADYKSAALPTELHRLILRVQRYGLFLKLQIFCRFFLVFTHFFGTKTQKQVAYSTKPFYVLRSKMLF